MKATFACLLVCVCVAVHVHAKDVDADVVLSHHKRGLIDDIFSGLTRKFSETVDEVLDLKDGDFEKVVKGVKNIGVATAKKIYGFFKKFSEENHDLDGATAGRIDKLMSALRDDIQERDNGAAGSAAAHEKRLSFVVAVFLSLGAVFFIH